jgi:hypothetical protein
VSVSRYDGLPSSPDHFLTRPGPIGERQDANLVAATLEKQTASIEQDLDRVGCAERLIASLDLRS